MSPAVPLADLLAQAEAARTEGRLADGLAAAEAAWAQAGPDTAARLQAGLLAVHFHYRAGAMARVVDHGLEVLPLAAGRAAPAERFDLLRMVALAALEAARFDTALACAQQAHRVAQDLDDAPRLALAVNALACCFERLGDPWQAERMMGEALAIARASGAGHPLLVTLNNMSAVQIGMFHLMRDAATPAEAAAPLHRALPLVREAVQLVGPDGDRFARTFIVGNLGEVLLHLGELAEARQALQDAHALAQQIGSSAQSTRLRYSLAELELAEGRPDAAWALLEDALATSADTDVRMTQLRIHHGLWRTARALGRAPEALHHLEQYLQLERERGLSQLRAQSELFVTRAEAEQVRTESRRDQLTRLGNRREVELRWPELIAQARRSGAPLAVALADLDHFKRVNDRYGHPVGDAVLVALAGLLRANMRSADLVARIGGEEFLLVLPDAPPERALEVCERLRQRVEAHDWDRVATGLRVTLSIGLTNAPPFDSQVLTARADGALYRAKAEGRNRVVAV
jgi:diguanylate cyclase (GGDEF)-like protein